MSEGLSSPGLQGVTAGETAVSTPSRARAMSGRQSMR
jgi:hypothetical protein